MQTVEPDRQGNFDATEDGGFNVVESDLETGDCEDAHAASLRRSRSAAQLHGMSSSSLCTG